jgi:Ran GTPase-activating protein (RanGAP) involved in mRNA processing and transport
MNRILLLGLLSVFGITWAARASEVSDAISKQIGEQVSGGVTSLDLRDRHIDAHVLHDILAVPELAKILELDLSQNPLGEDGAEALGRSNGLKALRRLSLDRCKLGYLGAKALSALLELPDLRELSLASNELGDTGAAAMAYSGYLDRLERLDLSDNGIGDDGARRFLESKSLRETFRLDLSRNPRISGSVRDALRGKFGDRVNFEAPAH